MLTFFDYLRQRAFESVLAGAQDALDVLERQKSLHEQQKQITQASEVQGKDGAANPRMKVDDKSPPAPPTADEKPIPPPRDRGRPMHESKGNK